MGSDVRGVGQPDGHLRDGGDSDRSDARSLEERRQALADAYRRLRQRVAELEAQRIRLYQRIDELKADSPRLDSDIAEIRAGHAEVGKELAELEALLVQLGQEQAELTAAGTAADQRTPQQRGDEPPPKRNTTAILALVVGAAGLLNANVKYIPYASARLAAFIVCRAVVCVVVVALFRWWYSARRTKNRSDAWAADPDE